MLFFIHTFHYFTIWFLSFSKKNVQFEMRKPKKYQLIQKILKKKQQC